MKNAKKDILNLMASIAHNLDQAGLYDDADKITKVMASVKEKPIRTAQFNNGSNLFNQNPNQQQLQPQQNSLQQYMNNGQQQVQPAQPNQPAGPGVGAGAGQGNGQPTMDQRIKQAVQDVGGMTNDEQNLAWQYVKWGEAQPNKNGLLNTVYQHASQNQSPQWTNKLIRFLELYGFTS